jgi:hypothetical protein
LLTLRWQAVAMSSIPPVSPRRFFAGLLASRAARDGAVIRRQVRDVERCIGREVFVAEMQRRGFPVVEAAGQFVIFCNREPIRRVCQSDFRAAIVCGIRANSA